MKEKEVNAVWHVQLKTTCPYCDEYQGDVLEDIYDNFERLGDWLTTQELHSGVPLKCRDCEKTYVIKSTEY